MLFLGYWSIWFILVVLAFAFKVLIIPQHRNLYDCLIPSAAFGFVFAIPSCIAHLVFTLAQ